MVRYKTVNRHVADSWPLPLASVESVVPRLLPDPCCAVGLRDLCGIDGADCGGAVPVRQAAPPLGRPRAAEPQGVQGNESAGNVIRLQW